MPRKHAEGERKGRCDIKRTRKRHKKGSLLNNYRDIRARKRKKQEKGYIFLNQSDHNDV